MKKNILVIGMGFVGYSNAIFFAENKKNNVFVYDIDPKKYQIIKSGKSPIKDNEIEKLLRTKKIELNFLESLDNIPKEINFIIIAVPTDFDEELNSFNTQIIETILNQVEDFSRENTSKPLIIIRSTVNIGFTDKTQETYRDLRIVLAPEFLREGKALYDNKNPSRIVLGGDRKLSSEFDLLLRESVSAKDIQTIFTSYIEAEAIKLFSNAYLAMRVSFFNELDSFSLSKKLSSKNIIEGISSDPRIGNYYNNPSFGFGGYCLPKDTSQLEVSLKKVPNKIISSINKANEIRKKYIVDLVLKKSPKLIGIYRLIMKSGSDNFRDSASISLIDILKEEKANIIIFEPKIDADTFMGFSVVNNLESFMEECDIVLANRKDEIIKDSQFQNKIFTRDIFENN